MTDNEGITAESIPLPPESSGHPFSQTSTPESTLPPIRLPPSVSSGYVTSLISGLSYHLLSAGTPGRPLILCLHGFPELAFSYRYLLPLLAASGSGYFVVAPDQRGCGRTVPVPISSSSTNNDGTDDDDDDDYAGTNLVRDVINLVHALGYERVHCLVGHDFGAHTASLCALARPDIFRRLVVMAHPYDGGPKVEEGLGGNGVLQSSPQAAEREAEARRAKAATTTTVKKDSDSIHADLAALPHPRKLYKWYLASAGAADELLHPLGRELEDFFAGYFYLKSGRWEGNAPRPLASWSAAEMARMPYYYTMPLEGGMREAVEAELRAGGAERARLRTEGIESEQDHAQTKKIDWPAIHSAISPFLPAPDVLFYAAEYTRTTFRPALAWYRISTSSSPSRDLSLLAGLTLDDQTRLLQIFGDRDWGAWQVPGKLQKILEKRDSRSEGGVKWIKGAGHWVQQEDPQAVAEAVASFCAAREL